MTKYMNIHKFLLIAVLAVTVTSCKKLDLFPASSIARDQSFQKVTDAKNWNAGMYNFLRGRFYGGFTFSTDVQSDLLNATLDFGNRNGNPHRWGTSFLADDYTIRDVWAAYYGAITNINVALEGFSKITPANAAEAAELNKYRGDAHLARAYYYHCLMLRWAKSYNPATASTDLGVPLVTKYDVNAQPARATSKEVYDLIISDINQAKGFLANTPGALGAKTFNIDVAIALEARVLLQMQNWSGAYNAANSLITGGKYRLINTATALRAYWHFDGNTESIFEIVTIKPNELAQTNSIYLGFLPATGRFTPDFVPSQWVVDEYADADIRKLVYFEQKPATFQGVNYNNVWMVNKYPGNPALFTGAATNYQHAPKFMRIAEMYLIAAEAAAMSNSTANALTQLNALRTSRGLTALSGLSGAALMNEIKKERFRELAFEGFRLDDLERWNEGFTRRAPQNTAFINVGSNYNTLTVPANDPKFVWGIPTNDITINPKLVQNPGW